MLRSHGAELIKNEIIFACHDLEVRFIGAMPKCSLPTAEGAIALNDVSGRVAWLLTEKATVNSDGAMVASAMTHLQMANLLGCTRPMVSRVMRQLELGGYIDTENHGIRLLKRLPARF